MARIIQEMIVKEENLNLDNESSANSEESEEETQATYEYYDLLMQTEPVPDGFKPKAKCEPKLKNPKITLVFMAYEKQGN